MKLVKRILGRVVVLGAINAAIMISVVMAKEVTLSHKGLSINANLTMAEDKTMDDGVVLITHGTLAHNGMEIIQYMQELLAERDRNSLALNLSLGIDDRHGMYDYAVPHTHLHTDALDEIGVWFNWLKSQRIKGIVLMGH